MLICYSLPHFFSSIFISAPSSLPPPHPTVSVDGSSELPGWAGRRGSRGEGGVHVTFLHSDALLSFSFFFSSIIFPFVFPAGLSSLKPPFFSFLFLFFPADPSAAVRLRSDAPYTFVSSPFLPHPGHGPFRLEAMLRCVFMLDWILLPPLLLPPPPLLLLLSVSYGCQP